MLGTIRLDDRRRPDPGSGPCRATNKQKVLCVHGLEMRDVYRPVLVVQGDFLACGHRLPPPPAPDAHCAECGEELLVPYAVDADGRRRFLASRVSCPMRRARLRLGNELPAVAAALMREAEQTRTGVKVCEDEAHCATPYNEEEEDGAWDPFARADSPIRDAWGE